MTMTNIKIFTIVMLLFAISVTLFTSHLIWNLESGLETWRRIALIITISSPYLFFLTKVGKHTLKTIFNAK